MAKRSKESVRYRDRPLGNKRCALCRHFLPPDACEGVAGKISPSGYCIRFMEKRPMAKNWYDRGKKGKDGSEPKGAEPKSIHERHAAEREETHARHAKARDGLHKQHEEELAALAKRHNDELVNAPGEGAAGGEPAAGAMNTAGAGAAAGTPAGVAGANAA